MPRATADGTDAKVVVVMPARNAARTLEKTISAIPRDWVDELILIDDNPTDDTVALARRIPTLHLVRHPHDVGYGGNQKTCFLEALRHDADVVVTLHPDGRYEPLLIPRIVTPILEGRADLVLGSRFLVPGAALQDGMPRRTYLVDRCLRAIDNRLLGTGFSDLHTGYRAYSRRLLLETPWLRNALDFSFDSELLFQAVQFGFRIEEVATRTIYAEGDSDMTEREGIVYAAKTALTAASLVAHRNHWWRSRKYLRAADQRAADNVHLRRPRP